MKTLGLLILISLECIAGGDTSGRIRPSPRNEIQVPSMEVVPATNHDWAIQPKTDDTVDSFVSYSDPDSSSYQLSEKSAFSTKDPDVSGALSCDTEDNAVETSAGVINLEPPQTQTTRHTYEDRLNAFLENKTQILQNIALICCGLITLAICCPLVFAVISGVTVGAAGICVCLALCLPCILCLLCCCVGLYGLGGS